jgi:hypothetical protein
MKLKDCLMGVNEKYAEECQTKAKECMLSYILIEKCGGILKQDGTRTRTN